jgi:hypothetical protein
MGELRPGQCLKQVLDGRGDAGARVKQTAQTEAAE